MNGAHTPGMIVIWIIMLDFNRDDLFIGLKYGLGFINGS